MRRGEDGALATQGRGRATEYLERVHVEIAGPMHVLSARGRLYLYVAVDDYSRGLHSVAIPQIGGA